MDEIIDSPGRFIDAELIKKKKAALDQIITTNNLRLKNKKKEPSQIVALEPMTTDITEIKAIIDSANSDVDKHNRMVSNLTTERQKLTNDVWRYVLNELEVDLKQYEEDKVKLEKAINGIESSMKDTRNRISEKRTEIENLEKQITSTRPTIEAINRTLKQFGFDSFAVADAGDTKHYKLIRPDGSDATKTLSEGEKTFIIFLYFYHLINGSFSETNTTSDRVVVFDDPVSSVDSDVLFIVSSLIRKICDDCRNNKGSIKQVFILTHNVFFHKEVTYNSNRNSGQCLAEETFWIIRKGDPHSQCDKHRCNPIKTSYELLWSEVLETKKAMSTDSSTSPRIENTLRRILEHYFKILGSIDLDQLQDKFDGDEKIICQSLISWVHSGSHAAMDDAHFVTSERTVSKYLEVFRQIFIRSDHGKRYAMMMGQVD